MAGGNLWTDEEYRIIAKCRATAKASVKEISKALKDSGYERGPTAVGKMRYHPKVQEYLELIRAEYGDELPTITPKADPEIVAQHNDPAQMWERAKQVTSAQIAYQKDRHEAEVGYVTKKPIALTFISDQHISQGGVSNLERMEEDARLVSETPGMYAVLGGDGVDNHVKHRAALVNSGSVPGKEWILYDHYLGIFGSRIAAMISGNHDDWTHDFVGIDMVQRLAEKRRIFYAPDFVLLSVVLKDTPEDEGVTYRVKLRHQYRFNSSLNNTHSMKRMWEMDEHDFDIGVICHLHDAAMEPFKKHGKWRWAFRPGSYQHTTGHSRRYGYGWSEPACPTVILWPGEKRMLGFLDVREAASYLTYLRQNNL
jgi:hypothetical protein